MRNINHLLWLILILPAIAHAWQWIDLWQTKDQQGSKLLQNGKAEAALQVFKDKNWQAVSHYRAHHYLDAFKQFNNIKTSDGQYNAGNAAAFMGKYKEAIAAYDKAITLNPKNHDAITNREIIKKMLKQKQQQKSQETQQAQQTQQKKQQNQAQNQQQNQQKKNASSSDKKDKNNASPQNNAKKNDGQQNESNKQNEQQAINKNLQTQANSNQPLTNDAKQNQKDKPLQTSGNRKENVNVRSTADIQQRQDENNKQLLRRLPDDPGGLLRQKFLRDYAKRHAVDENKDQEINQ